MGWRFTGWHPSPERTPEERIIAGTASGLRREARIDLDAFADNLRLLIARFGDLALDVRADAHGHSLDLVMPIATDLGVSGFLRSDPGEPVTFDGMTLVSSAAYGVDPDAGTRAVMTVVAEVVSVKAAPPGSGVSYGYSYRTRIDTTLALVGLGYADGVPRLASNRASVWVGGGIHPLVGRVAMDQFVVETGDARVSVGDEAILFGDPALGHPSAIDLAAQTGRSALELTAGIGPRVRRAVGVRRG